MAWPRGLRSLHHPVQALAGRAASLSDLNMLLLKQQRALLSRMAVLAAAPLTGRLAATVAAPRCAPRGCITLRQQHDGVRASGPERELWCGLRACRVLPSFVAAPAAARLVRAIAGGVGALAARSVADGGLSLQLQFNCAGGAPPSASRACRQRERSTRCSSSRDGRTLARARFVP